MISEPSILYFIGKLSAKHKYKMELGLECLLEYIVLIKSKDSYDLRDITFHKKVKAQFWIGVLYILLNQISNGFDFFSKINAFRKIYSDTNTKFTTYLDIISKFNYLYSNLNKIDLDMIRVEKKNNPFIKLFNSNLIENL